MNRTSRRGFLFAAAPLALFPSTALAALNACASGGADMSNDTEGSPAAGQAVRKLDKPHGEWKKVLSDGQYSVLFNEATERAGSSALDHEKRASTFVCAACYRPLLESSAKFDSGTGWPSFYQSIAGHVETKRDFKLVLPRTEYHCARCGGHQGHIFDDGPRPTGKRYCNNGIALRFILAGEQLPALRG
ncbi:MAG: peptide-methionine (R)-S-oxide reductase MsrB [Gemmatimonas sp.]